MTNPEAPTTRPLVELPSGVALRVENIDFIARRELNKFSVHFNNTPPAMNATVPMIDSADMDALREFGIIQKLVPAAGPLTANDGPKIEVAT